MALFTPFSLTSKYYLCRLSARPDCQIGFPEQYSIFFDQDNKHLITLYTELMLGIISKLFGGNKSDKDVKKILPVVEQINQHFASFASLSNDELRGKTLEFRSRIKEHLKETEEQIAAKNKAAEELPFSDLLQKDAIYQEVDKLKKEKDKKIEEA